MSSSYAQHINRHQTSQQDQAHPDQVQNSAGGFTFEISKWQRLDRFLILGCDGGTYYSSEKELTKQNALCIEECLKEDGPRVVRRIVEISDQGRAPKNDAAIFALALAASCDDMKTRQFALAELPKVCRIGTHLFHFARDVKALRKSSRSLRNAFAKWYSAKTPDEVAMQAVKYQQRDGWSHRDILRLSHAIPPTNAHNSVFRWITTEHKGLDRTKVGGQLKTKSFPVREYKAVDRNDLPKYIQAFEQLQAAKEIGQVVSIVREFRMPHETVPNEWKDRPEVWEALLDSMGITAMIRNLGKMTTVGLLKPLSDASKLVCDRLTNEELLKKGRVHPFNLLLASTTYNAGHGVLGKLSWEPVSTIRDALDSGFYLSFKHTEPTNKKRLVALDVSGSMSVGIAGTHLSAMQASAAMAMLTVRTEKNYHIVGFSANGGNFRDSGLTPVDVSAASRLDDVMNAMKRIPMGGTDCSLPMRYALTNKLEVDSFEVYTDSETYAGEVHPFQAIKQYRGGMQRYAKLVVNGMTATDFSIAERNDPGMLDCVGLDANTPSIIADFIRE